MAHEGDPDYFQPYKVQSTEWSRNELIAELEAVKFELDEMANRMNPIEATIVTRSEYSDRSLSDPEVVVDLFRRLDEAYATIVKLREALVFYADKNGEWDGSEKTREAVGAEPDHCPNCPDQGWYLVQVSTLRYRENEHGECVYDGEEVSGRQEQCEFCWTNLNSVFNQSRK